MSAHPKDVQKQVQQRNFENVTVGRDLSVGNITQIVNVFSQSSSDISSFCNLVEWIYEKSSSSSLECLPPCYSKRILEILKKKCSQKQDQSLDFTDFELKIFNLVFNFCHFYRNGGKPRLEKYEKFQEKDYYSHMKELIDTGEKIRVCSVRLSSIVADRDMSKLVQEVEKINEF